MATLPNFNKETPWSLASKVNDQQAKENQNMEFRAHQMNLQAEANARQDKNNKELPQRRYDEARAKGKADIENAQDAEAAGLTDSASTKRYRNTSAGDPKFFAEFMDTLRENGLTNPVGLAAVAGTGQIESGWSRGNVHRRWSDPSVSGQAGTSGLALSWRGDRLRKAEEYAASIGDNPKAPSARAQAMFFLKEDPSLVERLQNAPDLRTAMKHMNGAWKFAGYDTGGGSTGARYNAASNYLKTFGNAPETAKQRAEGIKEASGIASTGPTTQYDESGKEYFELQMDADGYKKVVGGMPNGRATVVPDITKPIGPKGQMFVRQYTGRTKTPTADPLAPNAPAAPVSEVPNVAKSNVGFDGTEEEL